ncbi:hypothetical protein AAGS61_14885 [Lysinibacillus sp. KU-BSD001]|uniref:hypothetical protein n=1 Tax=Lysinibacillus sp. KU-BSD001 TaxID=3141328 RepID=UPI0036F138D0
MRIESLGSMTTSYQSKATSKTNIDFKEVAATTNLKENESSGYIYEELSSKYDVRNATFEQIVDISHALYEAGELSFLEVSILTFDYGRATESIKVAAKGSVSSSFDMYETKANAMGQRDWIAEFEARATKDLQYGHLIGHSHKKKILHILQQLDR